MKKTISIILAVVLVLGLSVFGVTSQQKAYAKTAEIHLEIPEDIKKEQEFKVTVVLDSDTQLYSIDAYLAYNSELMEFIPDSNYVTGAEGILELKDVYGEETKHATYEITFRALETGMAEVALTDVYLIDYEDLDYITVASSAKQFEIGINRSVAEDARLSELVVAPGEFTETFDPNVLEYEMHVGLDIKTVGVSAIPMNEDSVVGLEMPDTLQVGENFIKVTVTALSGNVNEYVIKVIREEIEESSDEESVDDKSTEEESTEDATEEMTEEPTNEEAIRSEETTEATTEETTKDKTTNGEGTTEEATEDETTNGEGTEEHATSKEDVTGQGTSDNTANEKATANTTSDKSSKVE